MIAALIVGAFLWSRRARSAHLRDTFGPEYDRTVEATGDRPKAEADLAEREKRVKNSYSGRSSVERRDHRSLERRSGAVRRRSGAGGRFRRRASVT